MASKRARRWSIALIVVLALYATYRCTLHLMVKARLDEIRRQGYPVTLAELDKWYPRPPPAENAADVYEQAFKLLTPIRGGDTNLPVVGDAKLPPLGQSMTEETQRAVAEYLERNEQVVELLRQGAKLTQCRYPIDLTQGGGVPLPHLSKIRQSVRLLSLEAFLQAEHSEAPQAAQSILSSLALAHSLSAEPIYISQRLGTTCYWITAIHLEAALNLVSLSDGSLTELAKRFSELDARNALVRGYAGGRCFVIDFSKQPVERILSALGKLPPPPALEAKAMFLRVSGLFDIFLLHDLEAMKRLLKVCNMPFPEGVKQTKDADQPMLFTTSFLINGMRLGDDLTTVQRAAQNTAKVNASLASLAIERYRLAHSNTPNTLDELVPAYLAAVPVDTFDGQPLRYRKLAKGYIVYSVGEDGKDDGGDEKKDITFTVER